MAEPQATLHLVFTPGGLADCEARSLSGDVLVLMGSAVLEATHRETPPQPVETYLSESDAQRLGLTVGASSAWQPIGSAGIVDLSLTLARVVSWS